MNLYQKIEVKEKTPEERIFDLECQISMLTETIDEVQKELNQWKDGYWYHREGAEQLQKENETLKNLLEYERIMHERTKNHYIDLKEQK
jgi:regulator of replication initiation timing